MPMFMIKKMSFMIKDVICTKLKEKEEIFQKVPKWDSSHELGQIYMLKTCQVWLAKWKENLVFLPLATSC